MELTEAIETEIKNIELQLRQRLEFLQNNDPAFQRLLGRLETHQGWLKKLNNGEKNTD